MNIRHITRALMLASSTLTTLSTLADTAEPLPLINQVSHYSGALGYLDYGSGKNVSIPLQLSFMQSADKKHLIVDKVYTDPGYKVYSLSVIRIDLTKNALLETSFDNDETTSQHFNILSFDYIDSENWSLTRQALKTDDNQDARITINERMADGRFTSETRVDYLATKINENLKRNWIEAEKINGSTL